jgi:putative peptide zinc metalloprotease protein
MGDSPVGSVVPCRPRGVEPEGRLRGSGFAEHQWLVRRDARFVQLGEVLYRVVELADGSRSYDGIARELSASTPWDVAGEDVALIARSRLMPLGLLADPTVDDVELPARPARTLATSIRGKVLGPRAVDRVARILQHLHRPWAMALAFLVVAVAHVWLFTRGDPGGAIGEVVARPFSLPAVAGLLIVAGVFHEFGHASALRYCGGRARSMGVGLYLFLPVLYTDVTESYRLRRGARVRTDLGGLYFHLLAAVALIAAGAATGEPLLIVAAFLIDLDVARQLVPFIRLDGYWVLADLTGVPDLFSHAIPRLRARLGGRPAPALPALRPGVRRAFLLYVGLTVPAIAGLMAYAVWHAPSVLRTTAATLDEHAVFVRDAAARHDVGTALVASVEALLLLLPAIGLLFFAAILMRTAGLLLWRRAGASGTAEPPVEPERTQTARDPAPRREAQRAGEPVSLEAAIADHLMLKRRHAEDAEMPAPALAART